MGLVIKLKREGCVRQASYRIVVMEQTGHIQGKFLADLGSLLLSDAKLLIISVNFPILAVWLARGAKVTGRLKKYL
jgi:ribosomal protein S16